MIAHFKQGKRVLLKMATGGGKSKTAVSFVKVYQEHYIFILVVRTRDLVNQLAEDLKFFKLDYGIFMADSMKYDPKKEIQLCSIDTLQARGVYPHRFATKDIVLMIDEADQSKGEGYQEMIDMYCNRSKAAKPLHFTAEQSMYKMRDAFLFGMTATPYNGLPHFDVCIEPITKKELLAQGILVPYVYIIPKQKVNLEDIKVFNGEYLQKDIEHKLNSPKMIASCFQAWQEHGDNRQTLVFCVNQDHAKNMCKYINDYYGKPIASFVDSNTPEDERKVIYNKFRNGIIKFLINVRLITRGINIIEIGCIWDNATTVSINLHEQKLGRGSRSNPHYKDLLLIDCANNLQNNGGFYIERPVDLTTEIKRTNTDLEIVLMRSCEKCFRADEPQAFKNNTCPFCGHNCKPLKAKRLSKAALERLEMENATEEQLEQRMMIKDFKKILWLMQNGAYKKDKITARNEALYKMLDKYGKKKCLKIQRSISLTPKAIDTWEILCKNKYEPLGGFEL